MRGWYFGGSNRALKTARCIRWITSARLRGLCGGTAFVDNCMQCVNGTTGLEPCVQDCAGGGGTRGRPRICLWNTTFDVCGVCNGTGILKANVIV